MTRLKQTHFEVAFENWINR